MINSVNLAGNITRDPEMRSTMNGTSVMAFSIAVNERRKNGAGQWEDYANANYFDCTMFGTRAEKLASFLKRGTKVCITGRLKQERWEKDGKKHSKVSVIVDELEFMSPRDSEPVQAEVLDTYAEDVPF